MTKIFFTFIFFASLFGFSYQTSAKSTAANYPYIQNERLVPLALREIYDAQNTYQQTFGNGNFGAFHNLIERGLLSSNWNTNSFKKYGYYFQIWNDGNPNNAPSNKYHIKAIPVRHRKTGRKSFYLNHLGVIRAADINGEPASENEPVVGNFPYIPLILRTEGPAISNLRQIYNAQMTYQATSGNGNFGLLSDLYFAGLLNANLGFGEFGGYYFAVTIIHLVPGVRPAALRMTATPVQYNSTGIRSFYIDETGIMRGADKNGLGATVEDPVIEK